MGSNLSPVGQSAILLIRTYQKVLSPLLGQRCRFYPSCSQYTLEAIQEWGLAKGMWLGAKRLSRCHPLNEGGFDPVPKRSDHASPQGQVASDSEIFGSSCASNAQTSLPQDVTKQSLQANPEDSSHLKEGKSEAATSEPSKVLADKH